MKKIIIGLLFFVFCISGYGYGFDGYYHIIAKHSNKCLTEKIGAGCEQQDCIGDDTLWTLISNGSGYYNIIVKNSGKCLTVSNESKSDGAMIGTYECNGKDNKLYSLVSNGRGYYNLVAKHSGKCVTVDSESKMSGASIIQYECNGKDNKLWKIVK